MVASFTKPIFAVFYTKYKLTFLLAISQQKLRKATSGGYVFPEQQILIYKVINECLCLN